jgi:Arc/MetJ-type ribon-helix-helix transcriptional regulator
MVDDAMAAEIHWLRDKAGETEEITINLGDDDLGHIDLLVQEGFYSNRSDFIRTAIRNQLSTHGEEVRKSIVRHTLEPVSGTIRARIWRRSKPPVKSFTSRCLGSPHCPGRDAGTGFGYDRIDHRVAFTPAKKSRARWPIWLTPRIPHPTPRNPRHEHGFC